MNVCMVAVQTRNGGGTANLMDQWSTASASAAPPPQPEQLQADLQQQMANGVQPQLELQLGPQEMPVRAAARSTPIAARRGYELPCLGLRKFTVALAQ